MLASQGFNIINTICRQNLMLLDINVYYLHELNVFEVLEDLIKNESSWNNLYGNSSTIK